MEKLSFSAKNLSLVPKISRTQPLAACSSQAINVSDHKKTPPKTSQTKQYGKVVLQSSQKSEQFNNF